MKKESRKRSVPGFQSTGLKCAAVLLTWLPAAATQAQSRWIERGSGQWSVAEHWSNGVPDSSTQNASINNGGTVIIDQAGAEVGAGTSGEFFVGDSGDGTLEIVGAGTLSTVTSFVGRGLSRFSRGTGTVLVSGGTWRNSQELFVGIGGRGSLEIRSGGTVIAPLIQLAKNPDSSGTLNLFGGKLTTGSLRATYSGAAVTFNGGTLELSSNERYLFLQVQAGALTLTGAGGTIDTREYTVGIATGVALTGDGGLTKLGVGSLGLGGDNTFTGATLVEAGTLLIADYGSLNGSDVTVAAGAALVGGGRVSRGSLRLKSDGKLAPGAGGLGTLTLEGVALRLEPGSRTDFEVASASAFDRITVDSASTVTYGGTLLIDFVDGSYRPEVGTEFDLFVPSGGAGTTMTSGSFRSVAFSDPGFAGAFDAGTGVLRITAVPGSFVPPLPPTASVSVRASGSRQRAARFAIRNDGAAADRFRLNPSRRVFNTSGANTNGDGPVFRTVYRLGGKRISRPFGRGNATTPMLAPGQSTTLRIRQHVIRGFFAERRITVSITATSERDPRVATTATTRAKLPPNRSR